MNARWMIAREGHEIVKGRGAHRKDEPAAEPSLPRLAARDLRTRIRSAVSR